ncbi:MAG: hypothetical protein QG591_237 [Planctomycetota bacterium]|nr:hypothetical protein [Planctomycetota bacterium]
MNVSVIIPAHNAASTLAEALESLRAQTFADWEAIVVNDGSGDETVAIAASFAQKDHRIRVVSQSKAGVSAARNTGIGLARYEWLLFLDGDDWLVPQYFERMTHVLVSDPGLDAVYCRWARVAHDGTCVKEDFCLQRGDMFSTFAHRAVFPIHACIVRRTLVAAVEGFDTSFRTCEDWDLWQRIARIGAKFGAIDEILALYRMQPASASKDGFQMFADGFRVLKQGHAPDIRVKNPHPDHSNGMPLEQIRTQEFYLLCWCAGLLLGCNKDARSLLETLKDDNYPELYPDAVAQCIFEVAPLSTCRPPEGWQDLWPTIQHHVGNFLVALEKHSMAPDLACRAGTKLKKMILNHSPLWKPIIEEYEQTIEKQNAHIEELKQGKALIEKDRNDLQQLEKEYKQTIEKHQALIEELKQGKALIEKEWDNLQQLKKAQEQTIESQKAHIEELKQGKALIEKDRNDLQQLGKKYMQTIEKHQALIEELKQGKALIEQEYGNLQQLKKAHEQTIESQKAHIEDQKQSKALLEEQQNNWQRLAEERESVIAELQEKFWIRLGVRLGTLKQHNIVNLERNKRKNH